MKKNHLPFLFLISLLFPLFIGAQCPTDNISFNSQGAVDQFIIDYPDCTQLPGNARFEGSFSNFYALNNLDTIWGGINFYDDPSIDTFAGFENLIYVGGGINFDEAAGFTTFQGFNNVTYVGGSINIDELNSLESTSGFDNLTYIGNNLRINENEYLLSLEGFDNLITIGGNLQIEDNTIMENINGFTLLESVGGHLYISDNMALMNIAPLESLNSVGDFFTINRNDVLESLSAFYALTSIGGPLSIQQNYKLASLEGLNNIAPDSITELIITESDTLSFCSVESICAYLTMELGPYTIDLNETGCNTKKEIVMTCSIVSTNDLNNKNSLRLYPNPTNDRLWIEHEMKGVLDLSIISSSGIKLGTYAGDLRELDLRDLSSGMYFLGIRTEEGTIYSRFLKL